MKINTALINALFFAVAATPLIAVADEEPAAPDHTFTGHIDWVTKYILRGASETYGNVRPGLGNRGADAPESDTPALQWGVDYVDASGWYVGYWASQINYSYKQLGKSYSDRGITDFQTDNSIENDLYGGYSNKIGDFTYTAGFTGYYYYNGEHADALETKLGIAYGPIGFYAQTLLNDVVWGNKGDTYWTAVYTQPMPFDIMLTASLGYYTYSKEGKFLGTEDTKFHVDCAAGEAFNVNGCYAGDRPKSSGFRHFIVGITQPIGKTGLVWGVQGLLAGKNRFGIKQTGGAIGSISYTF
ncbi:MAG TPA: TorF family putative porin [Spongiibacteraceae bacterium]|jgi:uncharacterized protein (TIGR02001 family)